MRKCYYQTRVVKTQSAYGFSTEDGFMKAKDDKRTLCMIASYLLDV